MPQATRANKKLAEELLIPQHIGNPTPTFIPAVMSNSFWLSSLRLAAAACCAALAAYNLLEYGLTCQRHLLRQGQRGGRMVHGLSSCDVTTNEFCGESFCLCVRLGAISKQRDTWTRDSQHCRSQRAYFLVIQKRRRKGESCKHWHYRKILCK